MTTLKISVYYLLATSDYVDLEFHGNGHGMMIMMAMVTVMTTLVLTPLCTSYCYIMYKIKVCGYTRPNIATGRTGYKWKTAATLSAYLAWD